MSEIKGKIREKNKAFANTAQGKRVITKLWLVLIPYSTFFKKKLFIKNVSSFIPVDIGRKLNVHTTFRRRPVRSIYVLCVRG